MSTSKNRALIPLELVEQRILLLRGQKVLLDSDLAELYGVSTKRLNEQVRRNKDRFPKHFMFQLTKQELEILRSQFATTKYTKTRTPPYAFTEHGTLQAANVLNSSTAIKVSVTIIEAFVKLRELAISHAELMRKVNEHEQQIGYLFDLLKELASPSEKNGHYNTRRIGFTREEEKAKLRLRKKVAS